MKPNSLISSWRQRSLAAQEQETETNEFIPTFTQQDHDLVLRYALVGIFVIMATACLSITKTMTLPLTGGIIFGLVLGPLVDRMVKAGIPQSLAAGILVGAGTLLISAALTIFAAPFALWSDRLPELAAALSARLSGAMKFARQFEHLTGNLQPGGPGIAVASDSPLIGIAVGSSTAAGGALIFVATIYFYLATRRHLKARILRLCFGRSARQTAGNFFEEIESKVASYFGIVTVINLGIGLVAALVAAAAGLPFPLFWGVMAFILNYIAFIGPVIMTVLIFGAGLIDRDATLLSAVWPALAYFMVHLVEGNVITPIAVGRRLTVSPFLVFLSFIFWLWLWGPFGAILSTPILLVATVGIEATLAYRRIEATAAEARENVILEDSAPALATAKQGG